LRLLRGGLSGLFYLIGDSFLVLFYFAKQTYLYVLQLLPFQQVFISVKNTKTVNLVFSQTYRFIHTPWVIGGKGIIQNIANF